MNAYDEEVLAQWAEKEVRMALGATTAIADTDEREPWGRHKWFAEVIAEIATILALRRMSEALRVRPPRPAWRSCAPAIRQLSDERVLAAQLPRGITLAEWFRVNESELQRDPCNREQIAIVAAALRPLFEAEPACWVATDWLDFDMSHDSFSEYLKDWQGRVPAKLQHFVRQIAREFGLGVGEWESQDSPMQKPRL